MNDIQKLFIGVFRDFLEQDLDIPLFDKIQEIDSAPIKIKTNSEFLYEQFVEIEKTVAEIDQGQEKNNFQFGTLNFKMQELCSALEAITSNEVQDEEELLLTMDTLREVPDALRNLIQFYKDCACDISLVQNFKSQAEAEENGQTIVTMTKAADVLDRMVSLLEDKLSKIPGASLQTTLTAAEIAALHAMNCPSRALN